MCPEPDSKRQPFALWDHTQPTELHWSGPTSYFDYYDDNGYPEKNSGP